MADVFESRLARIENRVDEHDRLGARLEQRTLDNERRIDALTPLLTSVVTLTVEVKNLSEDLTGFIKRVDDREEKRERERISSKRWIIGIAVTLICALLGAAAILITSLH